LPTDHRVLIDEFTRGAFWWMVAGQEVTLFSNGEEITWSNSACCNKDGTIYKLTMGNTSARMSSARIQISLGGHQWFLMIKTMAQLLPYPDILSNMVTILDKQLLMLRCTDRERYDEVISAMAGIDVIWQGVFKFASSQQQANVAKFISSFCCCPSGSGVVCHQDHDESCCARTVLALVMQIDEMSEGNDLIQYSACCLINELSNAHEPKEHKTERFFQRQTTIRTFQQEVLYDALGHQRLMSKTWTERALKKSFMGYRLGSANSLLLGSPFCRNLLSDVRASRCLDSKRLAECVTMTSTNVLLAAPDVTESLQTIKSMSDMRETLKEGETMIVNPASSLSMACVVKEAEKGRARLFFMATPVLRSMCIASNELMSALAPRDGQLVYLSKSDAAGVAGILTRLCRGVCPQTHCITAAHIDFRAFCLTITPESSLYSIMGVVEGLNIGGWMVEGLMYADFAPYVASILVVRRHQNLNEVDFVSLCREWTTERTLVLVSYADMTRQIETTVVLRPPSFEACVEVMKALRPGVAYLLPTDLVGVFEKTFISPHLGNPEGLNQSLWTLSVLSAIERAKVRFNGIMTDEGSDAKCLGGVAVGDNATILVSHKADDTRILTTMNECLDHEVKGMGCLLKPSETVSVTGACVPLRLHFKFEPNDAEYMAVAYPDFIKSCSSFGQRDLQRLSPTLIAVGIISSGTKMMQTGYPAGRLMQILYAMYKSAWAYSCRLLNLSEEPCVTTMLNDIVLSSSSGLSFVQALLRPHGRYITMYPYDDPKVGFNMAIDLRKQRRNLERMTLRVFEKPSTVPTTIQSSYFKSMITIRTKKLTIPLSATMSSIELALESRKELHRSCGPYIHELEIGRRIIHLTQFRETDDDDIRLLGCSDAAWRFTYRLNSSPLFLSIMGTTECPPSRRTSLPVPCTVTRDMANWLINTRLRLNDEELSHFVQSVDAMGLKAVLARIFLMSGIVQLDLYRQRKDTGALSIDGAVYRYATNVRCGRCRSGLLKSAVANLRMIDRRELQQFRICLSQEFPDDKNFHTCLLPYAADQKPDTDELVNAIKDWNMTTPTPPEVDTNELALLDIYTRLVDCWLSRPIPNRPAIPGTHFGLIVRYLYNVPLGCAVELDTLARVDLGTRQYNLWNTVDCDVTRGSLFDDSVEDFDLSDL